MVSDSVTWSVVSLVIVDSGVKAGFLQEFASTVVTLLAELPEVKAIWSSSLSLNSSRTRVISIPMRQYSIRTMTIMSLLRNY
jgi:hypothetical protein